MRDMHRGLLAWGSWMWTGRRRWWGWSQCGGRGGPGQGQELCVSPRAHRSCGKARPERASPLCPRWLWPCSRPHGRPLIWRGRLASSPGRATGQWFGRTPPDASLRLVPSPGSRTSPDAPSIAGRLSLRSAPSQGQQRPLLLQSPREAVGTTPATVSHPNQGRPCPWQTPRPRLGNAAPAFLGGHVPSASVGTRVAG